VTPQLSRPASSTLPFFFFFFEPVENCYSLFILSFSSSYSVAFFWKSSFQIEFVNASTAAPIMKKREQTRQRLKSLSCRLP
jgi:hypothetical protein